MAIQEDATLSGKIADLWNASRLGVCVVLALVFNGATATYTHAGMEALEGQHPFVTIPFCFALTVIKLIYEKEFCANLFARRPRKVIFTCLGFLAFFAAASFFNLLNIVHTESRELSRTAIENEKLGRWHSDTEAVSKATAKVRAAIAQALGKNEAARREANSAPVKSQAALDGIQQERKLLNQADTLARSITPPPIGMPEDDATANKALTTAVSQIRNAAALLPAQFAAGLVDIQLSTKRVSDESILSHLGLLFGAGFATYSKPVFTAVCLELFSVLAMIAGFAGLPVSERIEGFKSATYETCRAIIRTPSELSIPFVISGTSTRGALILGGRGPVSYAELVQAVDAAAGYLPAPAVAMYNSCGELLDPDREVLTQLAGSELIVEVGDR